MSSNLSSGAVLSAGDTTTALVQLPEDPYMDIYWIFAEAVICFVTVFAIYLLICLARYATITRCKPGREIGGKKGKMLYRMCLVSVSMAVCRFAADQAVAITGWQSDDNCIISVSVSTVFYSMSLYPIYIFLWLRQSIFYANPVLSHVLNPVVTFISWATLFIMLSGGAVLTVIYVIPQMTGWDYRASPEGCRDIATSSGFDLVPTLVVCFTVSFQLSLLALFVYPLLTKKTQRYRSADPSSPNDRRESVSETYTNGHAQCEEPDTPPAAQQGSNVEKQTNEYPRYKSKTRFFKAPFVFYKKGGEATANTSPKEKSSAIKKIGTSLADKGRSRTSSTVSTVSDGKKVKRNKTQQGRRVILFIRKAFILTLICVLSDVVFTVVQMLIIVPELVYLAIFDINLLINIICIIMSFRDWPNMILPLCARRFSKRKHAQTTATSGNGGRANNTTRLILTMAQTRREAANNRLRANSSTPQEDSSSAAKEPINNVNETET